MARRIGLIGVPSSAGAHWPGQEKAPAALRAAGLVERLEAAGCAVVDSGDLPRRRFRPDPGRHPQGLDAVLAVAREVAERVEATARAGQTALVLGGDCTIELGTISGLQRAGLDPALLYVDGGLDLRTPADNPTGILDSMGVAHMIGLPGAAPELVALGPRSPLMADELIVPFGYEPAMDSDETTLLERRAMPHFPAERVRRDPTAVAEEALALVEGRSERFAVHFDVDVIDFVDFPVADVPQHNAGLTFREAMACLGIFAASPALAALTVTEFNPDHGDEGGELAARLAQGIANALAGRK